MTRAEAVTQLRKLREWFAVSPSLFPTETVAANFDTALEIAVDDVTAAAAPLAPNKWVEARLAEEREAIREGALEEAAAECRKVYEEHAASKSYPMNMGGLALVCEARIRALKTNTNPKQEGKP